MVAEMSHLWKHLFFIYLTDAFVQSQAQPRQIEHLKRKAVKDPNTHNCHLAELQMKD